MMCRQCEKHPTPPVEPLDGPQRQNPSRWNLSAPCFFEMYAKSLVHSMILTMIWKSVTGRGVGETVNPLLDRV